MVISCRSTAASPITICISIWRSAASGFTRKGPVSIATSNRSTRTSPRSPNAGGNMRLPQVKVDQLICHGIGNLMQASNGLRSIRGRILVDPDDAVDPGYGVAVRAQARAESSHAHGAIVAVARRFFAAPHNFHGTIQLFGDGYGLPDIVVLIATAKSAANKTVVDVNVLLRNAAYSRRIQQRFFRSLCSHP